MSEKEKTVFLDCMIRDAKRELNRMLSLINVETSEAFSPTDRENIFAVVKQSVGFNRINSMVFDKLRDWVVESTRASMREEQDEKRRVDIQAALAEVLYNQGKYDNAEPLYVSCLEKRHVSLGADHPDTLMSMSNLANFYFSQSKYDKAEPLFVSCLEKRSVSLGAGHHDTLMLMSNLANFYFSQSKYDKAEPLFVSCLEKQSVSLGADHPETLSTTNNLASFYFYQGKYDKAEPLFVSCLEKRCIVLGANHPDTLLTKAILANR